MDILYMALLIFGVPILIGTAALIVISVYYALWCVMAEIVIYFKEDKDKRGK